MTDESYPPEGYGEPPTEEAEAMAAEEMVDTEGGGSAAAFSSSEGMVALAGGLLILGWLIFGVLLNDYWISWIPLLLAILAVFLPRIDRDLPERIAPLPVLMKIIGYAIALIGVVAIIEDIRFSGSVFDEFTSILGALLSYAGYALAFLGARGIET